MRGKNGSPELLPGINFLYGFIGETREIYKLNLGFMKEVLRRGLLVRRINIRQVVTFSDTKMSQVGNKIARRKKEISRPTKKR